MSAASLPIRLSHQASADLDEILLWSGLTFGAGQIDAYGEQIYSALDNIAAFPLIGTVVQVIGTEYRRLVVAEHLVFYTVSDTDVEVVRIIHRHRDTWNHEKR